MSNQSIRGRTSRHLKAAVHLALGLGAVGAGLLPAMSAFAAEEDTIAEIIVTAQFREQNIQDTPLAITAVSAQMLESRSQTNIADVANQAPSVTLKQQSPGFGPSMAAFIRGVGAYDFNPALEPGVGIYVDDVYYATLTGSVLDLLDLDRVEILRGPQGTLAGRNSIGGSVKLYSQKAKGDDTGSISATYGSRHRIDLRASADFALADSLFARISGVSKKQDGYVDRIDYGCEFPNNPYGIQSLRASTAGCVVARDSDVNYSGVRAALRWLPNDNLDINLSGDYTSDHRNPTGAVLVDYRTTLTPTALARIQPVYDTNVANNLLPNVFVPPAGSYYNYASFYSPAVLAPIVDNGTTPQTVPVLVESRAIAGQFFEGWGTSLDIDFKFTDSTSLKSITAYRKYSSGFTNDNDMGPLVSSIGDGELPFRFFSQELRLNGAFVGNMFEYTVGAYYLDQSSRYQSWQDLRYTGPLQFQQNDVVNVDSQAGFAQFAYNATDSFTLTTGARYTKEHKDYNYVRLNRAGTAPAAIVGGLNGVVSNFDGNNFDYRIAAQYSWSDDIMTYVQYATGFKGGGISPRPFVIDQAVGFDPEKMKTVEVGVKADLFDRHLRVNADVYQSKYTDIQLGIQTCTGSTLPSPCGRIANAGDATIKGFELETTLRFGGFSADASYSLTKFQYDVLNNVGGFQLSMVAPFMPKNKVSAGMQYEFATSSGVTITPRVDVSNQSDMYANGNNQVSNLIEGYTLVNARLIYKDGEGKWEAALEGTNLGDKYYFMSRSDQFTGAGHTDGAPGRPREFAITVKRKFK